MQRFLKIFGLLAIVVGGIEIIDGFLGLIAEGTFRAMRPIIPGSFLVIAGVFMVREARAGRERPGTRAARHNEEL